MITFVLLLTGCTTLNTVTYEKDSWTSKTIKLVNSAKKDGYYYDYNILLKTNSDLNETLRYAEMFSDRDINLPEKTIDYIRTYSTEDVIEQLRINYILRLYNQTQEHDINIKKYIEKTINDPTLSNTEKISILYYISKFSTNTDEIQSIMSSYITSIKKKYEKEYSKDLGTMFEYTFLLKKLNLKMELDLNYYQKELTSLLETNPSDLYKLSYLEELIKSTKTELTQQQLTKIKQIISKELKKRDGDTNSINLLIINDFIHKYWGNDKALNKLLLNKLKIIKENNIQKDGGFKGNRIINFHPGPDLLARVILNLLGEKAQPENLDPYLLPEDTMQWRVKALAYNHFQLSTLQKEKISKDAKLTLTFIEEAYQEDKNILDDSIVVENIKYSLDIMNEPYSSLPNDQKKMIETMLNKLFNHFNQLDSTLQRYSVDIASSANYSYDKDDIMDIVKKSFDSNEKVFIKKDSNGILLNYNYLHIMNIMGIKEIKGNSLLSILEKFKDTKGGYNTVGKRHDTSSLITTYYGLILTKEIQGG